MIRSCPACSANNRVPARHLSSTGRCGSCKAPLPPVSEPIEVDAAAFAEITHEARVPVLVDFWAEWCGPCRTVAPEVHELAGEMAGRGLVLKVNTEEYPTIAAQFRVQAIPYSCFYAGG
jgi:thioredoxin 2